MNRAFTEFAWAAEKKGCSYLLCPATSRTEHRGNPTSCAPFVQQASCLFSGAQKAWRSPTACCKRRFLHLAHWIPVTKRLHGGCGLPRYVQSAVPSVSDRSGRTNYPRATGERAASGSSNDQR